MTDRSFQVVDLHEIVPDPPDSLLSFEQLREASSRRRMRRGVLATVGAIAATGAIVGGAVLVAGHTNEAPAPTGPAHVNGPLVFALLRPGPADKLVNTDLATASADGSNVRPLTHDGGADEYATVSPDGRTIAYVEETTTAAVGGSFSAHDEIHVVNIDGTDERRLYSCTPTCSDLAWAPEGDKLAFADDGIRVVGTDGTATLVCGSRCGTALAEPAWSPDGSKLAFSQRGVMSQIGPFISPSAIFLVNSDGSGLRKLTNASCDPTHSDCTVDTGPSWSPDGESIAFSRFPQPRPVARTGSDGASGVYLMRADGSQQRELFACPNQSCQMMNPQWSPDGRRLAFVGDAEQQTVRVMDVDSRQSVPIDLPAAGAGGGYTTVTWSPDGTKLALASYAHGSDIGSLYTVSSTGEKLARLPIRDLYAVDPSLAWAPATQSQSEAAPPVGEVAYKCGDSICLMRPDGTGDRTLNATFPEWDPAWSPNGQRLAFRGYYAISDGSYAIYVVDADGCHVTRLPGTDGGVTPTWSPDGSQIAFGRGRISVINLDGSHLRAVTDGGVTSHDKWTDSEPAWSPEGPIAFVRTDRGSTRGEIYTVNPDGTHLTAISTAGSGFEQPAWSHDGSQLAMVATLEGRTQIGGPLQIEVAHADGTSRHAVSPPSWSSFAPTWTPDGRVVFLVKTEAGGYAAYIVNPDGSQLHRLYTRLAGQADAMQITWGSATLSPAGCPS